MTSFLSVFIKCFAVKFRAFFSPFGVFHPLSRQRQLFPFFSLNGYFVILAVSELAVCVHWTGFLHLESKWAYWKSLNQTSAIGDCEIRGRSIR